MSAADLLAKLQAEERSLSLKRTRLQDRIDFIRGGGSGLASAAQVEEQLRLLLREGAGRSGASERGAFADQRAPGTTLTAVAFVGGQRPRLRKLLASFSAVSPDVGAGGVGATAIVGSGVTYR